MNGRTKLIEIVKESAQKRIVTAWWVTSIVCALYAVLGFVFTEAPILIGIPYSILIGWWYIRSIKNNTRNQVDVINLMYDEHEKTT